MLVRTQCGGREPRKGGRRRALQDGRAVREPARLRLSPEVKERSSLTSLCLSLLAGKMRTLTPLPMGLSRGENAESGVWRKVRAE